LFVLKRTLKRREQRLRAPAEVSVALREESPTLGLSRGRRDRWARVREDWEDRERYEE